MNTDALGIAAKMTASCPAVSAMATGQVAFPGNAIALLKSVHGRSHLFHHAVKLMPNDEWDGNSFLCPMIPVVNVRIRSANSRLFYPNQKIIITNLGFRDVLHR